MHRFVIKSFLFISLLISLPILSYAQDPETNQDTVAVKIWTKGGSTNITFAQVGLRNWVGGGQSSVSLNGIQILFLNMNRGKLKWNNNFELGLGMVRLGNREEQFRKSDDRLILLSRVSREVTGKWFLTGLLDFRSQIFPGFEFGRDEQGNDTRRLISDFMAPAYVISSLGWEFRQSENIFFILSPVTVKSTIVANDEFAALGMFGVDPGRNIRNEVGAFVNTRFRKEVWENVTIDTRLNLFGNYENLRSIDVNWDLLILLKVNKYITTSLSTHLLYDDDIDIKREDGTTGPAVQFKHVVNVGLMYKFDR